MADMTPASVTTLAVWEEEYRSFLGPGVVNPGKQDKFCLQERAESQAIVSNMDAQHTVGGRARARGNLTSHPTGCYQTKLKRQLLPNAGLFCGAHLQSPSMSI